MEIRFMRNWWRTWHEVAGHWQNLRPYFRPLIVRSFISWFAIAPIVLNILQKLPKEMIVPLADREYTIVLQLPFNWYVLWVASFLFFLAYLLYMWAVPRFVYVFPDFSDFLNQHHSPRFLAWELSRVWRTTADKTRLATRLIEKNLAQPVSEPVPPDNPRVEERGTAFVFEYQGEVYEVVAHENDSINRQRELFWEIYGPPAASAPVPRNVTWFLLTASFVLVGIVVLQHICFVLWHLIDELM